MKLKQLRVNNGYSQQDVADKLGCMVGVYSRYEREERELPLHLLVKLGEIYGVSLNYILDIPIITERDFAGLDEELFHAAHQADERAVRDAIELLKLHPIESEKQRVYKPRTDNK